MMSWRDKLILISAGILAAGGGYMVAPKLAPHSAPAASTSTKKDNKDIQPPALVEGNKQEFEDDGVTPRKDKLNVDVDDLLGGIQTESGEDDTPAIDDSHFIDDDADITQRIAKYKKDEKSTAYEEPEFNSDISSAAWRNPGNLKRQIGNRLRAQLSKVDDESIAELLKKPENRLAIAQWQLLSLGDEKKLRSVLGNADTAKELAPLLNSLSWVSSFVYDGELNDVAEALALVYHLRKIDPKMDEMVLTEDRKDPAKDPDFKRKIAGSVAAAFVQNGWTAEPKDRKDMSKEERERVKALGHIPKIKGAGKSDIYQLARERYLFFAESVDKRLLNPTFYSQAGWLRRIVCGWKGDSAFGTASTMRWLRDNCAAQPSAYPGMCSQVPYLPTNIFGDSIHGPFYYQPFDVLYPGNFAKETRDVGAVCGGLSHFGASSANANGVPAFTMGEPGHCAYAVYVDGKWIPANSIFPEKFPHWSFWGESTWSAMEMYTSMYEGGKISRDAQLISSLAALCSSYKFADKSLKLYELAVTMQPLYRPAWKQYMDTAVKSLKKRPKKWLAVNNFLCKAMTPQSPEVCSNFLLNSIYPHMLGVMRNDFRMKNEAFKTYFASLDKQEENLWDPSELLDMQYQGLGRQLIHKRAYLNMLAEYVIAKPEFGPMLTWAIKTAYAISKRDGEKYIELIDSLRESSPNVKLVDAAVIRAAEEVGDKELFIKQSKPYVAGLSNLPDLGEISGNLISDGAMISMSSYFEKQEPIVYHASALSLMGGSIQSEGGKQQTVTVILPKVQRIGTVVIVPEGGSLGSYWEWKMDISTDGQKWTTFAELPDKSNKPFLKLTIKKSHPNAKYVRIYSGSNQTQGIKFKALLIYDNKKTKD